MSGKKKAIIFFVLFLTLISIFYGVVVFLGRERTASLVKKVEGFAKHSFKVLGLDGKSKNPVRDRKNQEEKTSAELEILSVGENMVYFPEFAFYFLSLKKDAEAALLPALLEFKGERLGELVLDEVLSELKQLKIVSSEAKKAELTVSPEEKEEIERTIEEQLKGIDPLLLAKYYIDPELLLSIYEENFLAEKFYGFYIKEKQKKGDNRPDEVIFKEAYEGWESSLEVKVFHENIKKLSENGSLK